MALQYKSIDTMKVSRDSNSYTTQQITDFVNQYTSLGLTHLTLNSFLDGTYQTDAYILKWITAIRNAGLKIWWRGTYTNPYDQATPSALTELVSSTPTNHPTWFQNGDIYDMLAESNYGNSIFGGDSTTQKSNWNKWIRDTKASLDAIFLSNNTSGVITGITSITDFTIINSVETETFTALGYATIDHYPADSVSDGNSAVKLVFSDLDRLHAKTNVNIIIGEFGFSRSYDSPQSLQREVLRKIFNEIKNRSWIVGYNYWVGHGGTNYGSYCNLFEKVNNIWAERAALKILSEFYKKGYCSARMTVI